MPTPDMNREQLAAAIKDCLEQGGYLVLRFGHAQMRQLRKQETDIVLAALCEQPEATDIVLVKAALEEWHHGQLPAVQALWAIYSLFWPKQVPTDDDLKWAMEIIAKRASASLPQ